MLKLFFFLLFFCNLCATHTAYIDGGGSNARLYLFNDTKELVFTNKTGGTNLNTVSKEIVKEHIAELLMNVPVDTSIYGGFAGVGVGDNASILKEIFFSFGFSKVEIKTDAELLLSLIDGDAILIIAGTGSVCLARKGNEIYMLGGLGRLIGDEGSGYFLGMLAIKKALEAEQGWGKRTILLERLKDYFQVSLLKDMIVPIHKGVVGADKIAAIASIVFAEASFDEVANEIITYAGSKLSSMIEQASVLINGPATIILYGSLFKNEQYIKTVIANLSRDVTFHSYADATIGEIVLNLLSSRE